MLNCREFTLLTEQMNEEKQTLSVRFNFAFHKLLCKDCAAFVNEFNSLSKIIKSEIITYKLSNKTKEKINNGLQSL